MVMAWPSGRARAGEFDRAAPPLSGVKQPHCGGPGQGLGVLDVSADCRRINGYIAAGARFESGERIGAGPDPFAPLGEPGTLGGRGVTIVGAPLGRDRLLPPSDPGEAAR
jgi:hypothetical protein